jgi:hypothetical protein
MPFRYQDNHGDHVPDPQHPHWQPARGQCHRDAPHHGGACRLLDSPGRGDALRQLALVTWIDGQGRHSPQHDSAYSGPYPAQRPYDSEAHYRQQRDHGMAGDVGGNHPTRRMSERQIFSVARGPVVVAEMMLLVYAVVKKRRRQQRHAAQRVPHGPETRQLVPPHVHQLVGENHRPIQSQRRQEAEQSGQPSRTNHGQDECHPPERGTGGEIPPVQKRVGLEKVGYFASQGGVAAVLRGFGHGFWSASAARRAGGLVTAGNRWPCRASHAARARKSGPWCVPRFLSPGPYPPSGCRP